MQIIEILRFVENNTNSAFFYTPTLYKEGKSYLFKTPCKILKGKSRDEIFKIFDEVDEIIKRENLIGYATIPYEIGYYFQPKQIKDSYLEKTELRFLFYEKQNVEIIDSNSIKFEGVDEYLQMQNTSYNLQLDIAEDEYVDKIKKIKDYIKRGDTYQINFTTTAKFQFRGELVSLFLNGIFNQSARYSVLMNTESEYIFSFSPELFFSTDYKTIFSKPMKGTIKRKENPKEDKIQAKSFLKDEKTLAENVMIVDLMRNDIGRIAITDSVEVEKLYEVEKYETLYQLTSMVVGKLKNGKLSEIFKNLFPSGSITGAPKIRSMQIIAELEKSLRNIYTGSIGLLTNNYAVFNIPIRTLSIDKMTKEGQVGLGSGIVWDSDALREYDEVLLKSEFINTYPKYFELLETMLFENGEYYLKDYHVERLRQSADYFLFAFDDREMLEQLEYLSKSFDPDSSYKIRILLSKWGNIKIESEKIKPAIHKSKVILCKEKRCDVEKFLYHKTSCRPWDEILKSANQDGFDEVLFYNENGELLEGAISNLLIKKNDLFFTPPVDLGLLNGCYREYLLDRKLCSEKNIQLQDLKDADDIILINSVKKEVSVSQIYDISGDLFYEKKEC